MASDNVRHTYRIINKPLTWFGCDKWLVLQGFMLLILFAGVYGAILPGIILMVLFMTIGHFKANDPVRLALLASGKQFRFPRYDPGKRQPFVVHFK